MAKTEWRTYQGQKYLYIDHAGTEQETVDNIEVAIREIKNSGDKNLRVLGNSAGAYGTKAVMDGLTKLGNEAKPYVTRWAVIGVTGIKKVLLKTFNTLTGQIAVPKDNEDEALTYLFEK